MRIIEMRDKLKDVANEYVPVRHFLDEKNLQIMVEDFTLLYAVFHSGGDLKQVALDLGTCPDDEEADELVSRIEDPTDFIDEFMECMYLLVDTGVVVVNKNKLRLVTA